MPNDGLQKVVQLIKNNYILLLGLFFIMGFLNIRLLDGLFLCYSMYISLMYFDCADKHKLIISYFIIYGTLELINMVLQTETIIKLYSLIKIILYYNFYTKKLSITDIAKHIIDFYKKHSETFKILNDTVSYIINAITNELKRTGVDKFVYNGCKSIYSLFKR